MNSLSWFLYLAEAGPSLAVTVGALSIFALLGVGIAAIFVPIFNDFSNTKTKPPYKTMVSLCIVALLVSAAIPSKDTIYLIAGSEAGEYVVTSPEGQEIINDIKAIIKSQIEELK